MLLFVTIFLINLFDRIGEQFEVAYFKPVVDYISLHFGFPDSFAKTFFGMSITVGVDICTVNKIGFTIYPHGEVTTFSGHFKLAFATGGIHYLYLFRGIRQTYILTLVLTSGKEAA